MKDFIATITLFGIKGECPIFSNFDLISNIIFSATLREHEPNFSWRSISFIT